MSDPFENISFHSLPIRAGDTLRVTGWNTVATETVLIIGRSLSNDGEIVEFSRTFKPNTSTAGVSIDIQMTPGRLISLAAWNLTARSRAGRTFLFATLFRGSPDTGAPFYPLLSGYLGANDPLNWPFNTHRDISNADPVSFAALKGNGAAGASHLMFTPQGEITKIRGVSFDFTTDANVANRTVTLELKLGGTTVFKIPCTSPQTASTTRHYEVGVNLLYYDYTTPNQSTITLIDHSPNYNYSVLLDSVNIQAGDQFTNTQLFLDTWADPQSSITS